VLLKRKFESHEMSHRRAIKQSSHLYLVPIKKP